MYSPAEATNSLPFSSPYPAIPGPLFIQIKTEIIYYIMIWFTDTVNSPVENQCSISASTCIKPSLWVRGQENLEGGGRGEVGGGKRERTLLSTLLSSLFPLETPDTQANVQWIKHRLVIQIMQSVKFGTQTPREKKMHSQKSLSCQRYRMKHCLECLVVNYLFQLIFIFPLFLGMVMYANELKIKEKQQLTEIEN